MKKDVYIIGNQPNDIDADTQLKYYKVQMMFIELGYNAVNPLERLCNEDYTHTEAKKKNIRDLMNSYAVYIMPDVELTKSNIEIKIAIDFNLCIIISMFDCAPTVQTKSKRPRIADKQFLCDTNQQ